MIGHPLLHNLVCSYLEHYPNEAIEILRRWYRGRKLVNDYYVSKVRREVPIGSIKMRRFMDSYYPYISKLLFVDVVWVLERRDKAKTFHRAAIKHEVKTGNYDIVEVVRKYKRKSLIREYDSFMTEKFLYIWSWYEKHLEALRKLEKKIIEGDKEAAIIGRDIKRGVITLVPLEIIMSKVREKLNQLENIFKENEKELNLAKIDLKALKPRIKTLF